MISKLESWYTARCDGEWEHAYGITIDTLDNPGWRVKIDLKQTSREDAECKRTRIERGDQDWIEYWAEKHQFHIACGPQNLSEAISIFADWFDSIS
ncbi:MAG: immunity 53 family protein [Actinomycetota bacterium]